MFKQVVLTVTVISAIMAGAGTAMAQSRGGNGRGGNGGGDGGDGGVHRETGAVIRCTTYRCETPRFVQPQTDRNCHHMIVRTVDGTLLRVCRDENEG